MDTSKQLDIHIQNVQHIITNINKSVNSEFDFLFDDDKNEVQISSRPIEFGRNARKSAFELLSSGEDARFVFTGPEALSDLVTQANLYMATDVLDRVEVAYEVINTFYNSSTGNVQNPCPKRKYNTGTETEVKRHSVLGSPDNIGSIVTVTMNLSVPDATSILVATPVVPTRVSTRKKINPVIESRTEPPVHLPSKKQENNSLRSNCEQYLKTALSQFGTQVEKNAFLGQVTLHLLGTTIRSYNNATLIIDKLQVAFASEVSKKNDIRAQSVCWVNHIDELALSLLNVMQVNNRFDGSILTGAVLSSTLQTLAPGVYAFIRRIVSRRHHREHTSEQRELFIQRRIRLACIQLIPIIRLGNKQLGSSYALLMGLGNEARGFNSSVQRSLCMSGEQADRKLVQSFLNMRRPPNIDLEASMWWFLDNCHWKVSGVMESTILTTTFMGGIKVNNTFDKESSLVARFVCFAPAEWSNLWYGCTFPNLTEGAEAIHADGRALSQEIVGNLVLQPKNHPDTLLPWYKDDKSGISFAQFVDIGSLSKLVKYLLDTSEKVRSSFDP